MRFLTPLLYPFGVLYDVITRIRNRLYDTGRKPSAAFNLPMIGVGNLSTGGTGKTPMIEYLIHLFEGRYRIATLSRGYGRKTKGVRIAGQGDNASTIGDEPFQFYRKFHNKIVVAVGEERVFAVPQILQEHPAVNLILLDDAFQHRRIKPSFQILLTDYSHLFVNDYLLPAGRLREGRSGASRADAIVVTKCPSNISDEKMMEISSAIRKYSSKAVFFATVSYRNIQAVSHASPYRPENIVLVSGIAHPETLEKYVSKNHKLISHFAFRDHHHYREGELIHICETATKANAVVLTTEKDLVKMDLEIFRKSSVPLFFLPIEIEFLKNGKEFDEMVLNAVRTYGG
jgi:tetraacyldisaccharide 4'-kinase